MYSNKSKEYTIDQGCPWYEAQQQFGAPNVNWCEPTQCSVINEPANAWSNLPYLIVALVLYKKLKNKPLNTFSWTIAIMGLFSFTYHATNNYLSQFFDFIGMFLMMSFVLAFEVKRFFSSDKVSFCSIYWFLVFLNTLTFTLFGIVDWPVQTIMMINTLPIIALEMIASWRDQKLHKLNYFVLSIGSLAIAQGFALVDIHRIYCKPDNLFFHGHVIWHIVSALGMLFAGLHLKKIKDS